MTQEKIQMFIMGNQNRFESSQLPIIMEQMKNIDDNDLSVLSSVKFKDPITVLILLLFFGGLGVDRFVIGEIGMGILKLFTCGCFGILTIIDWFIIMGKTRKKNFEIFMETVNMQNVYCAADKAEHNSENNSIEEIKKYKYLFDAGAINEEEFTNRKKELLK